VTDEQDRWAAAAAATLPVLAISMVAVLLGGVPMILGGLFNQDYMEQFKLKQVLLNCRYETQNFAVTGRVVETTATTVLVEDAGDRVHLPYGFITYVVEKVPAAPPPAPPTEGA
jgi:hypothetical protein